MQNIDELKSETLKAIADAQDAGALEAVRIAALGKKGSFASAMQTLAQMPQQERAGFGASVNIAKSEVTAALESREAGFRDAELAARLESERLDVTLPVRNPAGSIHPITQTIEELIAIFADMGFSVAEGPDIEDDWHNFEALNFTPDHPARQTQDTFYLPQDAQSNHLKMLRTQTSNVQIRTMMEQKPPIRIISPGRVFRSDSDQTHSPMFHQIEALVIDETASMANLRGTVMEFLRAFFGIDDLPVRFRPHYFPFTEPSAEFDMGCERKDGKLKIGNYGDWIELGGCGMVHQNVLKNCGIDPDKYQGFALGFGIERMAMLKYGIPDIRSFFESDMRWLRHYGFPALSQPNLATGL